MEAGEYGETNPQLPLILKKREEHVRLPPNRNNSIRVVNKKGRFNISLSKIPNKELRFIRDLGNTLIQIRWRWILLTLVLVNGLAYVTFSAIFMFDAWLSGDWDLDNPDHKTCIVGTNTYVGYLLLGIETITTTGYGYVYPTQECKFVWFALTLSTIVMFFIEGAFITVVYVKISRPINKDVVKFSKRAVVCLRNGILCLVFRVSDKYGKHAIKTKINACIMREKVSAEGDVLSNYFTPLKLEECGVFRWPTDVVHRITPDSPLWDISANDLMTSNFEILVVLRGDSMSLGQTSQSQASYVSREILWGQRFESCIEIAENKLQYYVNYNNFNRTISFDTPLCSAKQLKEFQSEIGETKDVNDFFQ